MHCLHNLAFAVAQQARLQGTLESGGVALQLRRLEEARSLAHFEMQT